MKKADKKNGNGAPPGAPMKDEIIVLAGRRFVMSNQTTFRQDARMIDLAEQTGLVGMFMDLAAKHGKQTDPNTVRAIVTAAFRKGTLFQMLATAVREEGQERWTVEHAEKVAEFMADLTDPDDKEKLHNAVLGIILGFFVAARDVWHASQPSAATPSDAPSPTTPSTTGLIAAPTSAATGPE